MWSGLERDDYWCSSSSVSVGVGMLLLHIYSAKVISTATPVKGTLPVCDIVPFLRHTPCILSLWPSFFLSTLCHGVTTQCQTLVNPGMGPTWDGGKRRLLCRCVMNVSIVLGDNNFWRAHNPNTNFDSRSSVVCLHLAFLRTDPRLKRSSPSLNAPPFLNCPRTRPDDIAHLTVHPAFHCWEADFLTDSEIIWTVQLHFSTLLW